MSSPLRLGFSSVAENVDDDVAHSRITAFSSRATWPPKAEINQIGAKKLNFEQRAEWVSLAILRGCRAKRA